MRWRFWEGRGERISRRKPLTGRQKVLLLLMVGIALFSGIRLLAYGVELVKSRQTTRQMRDAYLTAVTPLPQEEATQLPAVTPPVAKTPLIIVCTPPGATPTVTPIPTLQPQPYPNNPSLTLSAQFKNLRKINRDIVAWLHVDRLIDEAVVLRDNEFYLTHDAKGEKNNNGAVFLDAMTSLKTRPYALILYGHNMKSGAMFGSLRNYERTDFYHRNPFVSLDTLYETGEYVIFSVGTISVTEGDPAYVDFYALQGRRIDMRRSAIQVLQQQSVYTSAVEVLPEDQLLLLVTCTDRSDQRRVIAARRIRPLESKDALLTLVKRSTHR